jgi:hypothetical protein
MRLLLGIIGLVMTAFFSLILILSLGELVRGLDDPFLLTGMTSCFGLLTLGTTLQTAWGFWPSLRSLRDLLDAPERNRAVELDAAHEVDLLRQARSAGGRLTAEDVALYDDVGYDEAQRRLVALVNKGVAEPWVNDDGLCVYVFPAFLEGGKQTAVSPLAFEEVAEQEGVTLPADVTAEASVS